MVLLTLLTSLAVSAAPLDGTAAFQRIKGLEGSWKADAKSQGTSLVTWRVLTGDRAVLETVSFTDKTKLDAVVLFALDKGELTATVHDGKEPLQLKLMSAAEGRLEFGAGKGVTLVLTVTDARVVSRWVGKEGGGFDVLREYVDTLK